MTLIDRLIADEAIRMLSEASSGNKTTSLNEPCEPMEIVAASTRNELTETTTTPVNSTITEQAAVRAADSMLLQKSAEQVTKKLINQLSTMNKYDLKQIIHNPAGKYETALNKHAQNKLRAEVRKQLNNIRVNEMISPCGNGVEPDEAIDAEKIHPELLEQIGKTLDLNFFTLPTIDLNELNQREVPSEEVVDKYSLSLKDIGSVNKITNSNNGVADNEEQRTNNSDTCAPSSPGYILPDNIEGTHLSSSVIDNASANDQPLGNEIEDKYSPDLNGSENAGTYPQLTVQDSPIDSVLPSTRLQHLLTIIEQMESIEAQTMQLFNRKMQIDATIMRLNSERMEIDQQLVQLQNDRGKQLSTLRLNMLDTSSIGTSRSVSQTHANDVANLAPGPLNLGILNPSEINQNQQFNAGVQQERTIRRITPISGKSVLMQIFQRMRASSERSTDDNPVIDHA
ncbi:uncharacterized protein LOC128723986 [Anopheles nili]|uniref:uncharacterized protein LOC128723986 n=1 Tax=Anopheles nili TaxID=185578 RepID=UPI00237BF44B|nr:uncharacterized protein LOC128723986 [Anopheles nili]